MEAQFVYTPVVPLLEGSVVLLLLRLNHHLQHLGLINVLLLGRLLLGRPCKLRFEAGHCLIQDVGFGRNRLFLRLGTFLLLLGR